ncbi:uncharacterized protein LOC134141021 isoform X3 [Rhea pennata]|uniref:uncharacterized protein LOC134141021 isoform X3 n=1 Tax=Rhea pennata TaxID=8795 RepID=UPI002E26AEF6
MEKSGKGNSQLGTSFFTEDKTATSRRIALFFFYYMAEQETRGSAWVMKKMKCFWGLFRGGSSKGEKATGEGVRMLPKTTWKERNELEARKRGRLKNETDNLLKIMTTKKKAAKKKPENENLVGNLVKTTTCRKEVEVKSAEEICGFIEHGKFCQASERIYDLEHSGSDSVGKSESLYTQLAEEMWSTVGKAFSGGERISLEPLQSVGKLLKWEKKLREEFGSSQGMEPVSTWIPRFWKKDLEEKLTEYMTAQIPYFDSTSNTDETALKQHLKQLEMTFLPSLECRSDFFEEAGLPDMYAWCFHACLSSHISTLTDNNHVSFSRCLLVYEWFLEMYKRALFSVRSGKWTLLGLRQTPHHLLSLDAQCLMGIILKTEEKLLAVTQKEVREALKKVFDSGESPCASAAVIQVIGEKTEAAERVGKSLRERVEAVCLEEYLSFLRRDTWNKLTYICSASTDQDVKVKGFLDQMEDKIVEHLRQTITSEVKGILKNHFKNHDSSLSYTLELLRQSFLTFKEKNTGKYKDLVKAVKVVIITEYVQALLTTSRKPSSRQRRRIVSKIEEDYRILQTIFEECLGPEGGSLQDPIKAILELIQTSDAEGMKIALLPILRDFPDLRQEHLNIILDLKDSLSRRDRAALLKIFHDNCEEIGDIEVKSRTYGLCDCFC